MDKNIIGLNIDESIIKSAVVETTKAAILASMSDNGLAEQLVHEVLSIKVDKDGKIATSSWGRESGITYLEYIVKKAIQDEAKSALKEALEENRPALKEAIKRELEKDSTRNEMINNFMSSMIETISYGYCTTVNVQFEEQK
ncbi:hypothetical protein [uncultured Olegusella sp.]|uniref:hypothetical protein n=1 Tax=uncultured Olegusella sp. TaxID=1979846 RepID=UPI00262D5353|nr:hypothetical protein [uncultured Olegusella sp.]